MSLTPGAKLGPYEILSLIGEGGMGQVWKARDTRLDRIVAIKTSAARFSERFEREARAVAALNHPHICTLYDVGPDYLVMEYVEGAEIKGPLPLDQALKYAIQLTSALEAAHRKTITHRDLKPANILITKAGVKVLDFGLAKFEGPKSSKPLAEADETLTRALTQEGSIVGTLQYMAPEQLQGKMVDTRADIFSFGCVLHETLTGKRAFDATNTASLIAAILERPAPSITEVAPPALDWVLRRCLAKDPDDRWQSARDLRAALERVTECGTDTDAQLINPPHKRWFTALAALAAGTFAIAAAILAFIHFRETPPAEPVIRATLTIPENSSPGFVALSPDGRRLVISMRLADKPNQFFLRSLDSPQLRPLPNTESARAPFWSPDGKFIGFFSGAKLKTIPVSGGPAQTLCDAYGGSDGAWNSGGVILFTNPQGAISRVSASGGACTVVTKAESPDRHLAPALLPDGKHFFYSASGRDESMRGVFLASIDDLADNGAARRVLADPVGVVYAPRRPDSPYGHLLFLRDSTLAAQRDSTLVAQPFDERSLQTAGDPFVVNEQASRSSNNTSPALSVSPDGVLIFVANRSRDTLLAWRDRSGKELTKVGSVAAQSGASLSPDGKIVATTRAQNGVISLWLRDLARDSESMLTEPGQMPVWSPDAKRIVYTNGNDLFLRDAAGGSGETALLRNGNPKYASDWSKDGRYLLYTEIDPKTGSDIWYIEDPLGKPTPVRFPGQNGQRSQPQFSPDGHWVAYYSADSGASGVYIRPFPNGSGQWKVSTDGGREPRWSENGKEILYVAAGIPNRMMAASIHPGGADELEVGVPQKLFEFRAVLRIPTVNEFSYAVAADGRFLLNVAADNSPPTIEVISNWQNLAASTKGN